MFLGEADLSGNFLTIGFDDRAAALRRLYNNEPAGAATYAIYRSNDMTKIVGGFATYEECCDYGERLVLHVRVMFLSPLGPG